MDFDKRAGRRTEVTFKGASVLRDLAPASFTIPTVDISLTTVAEFLTLDGPIAVSIKVEPNGQRVSAVDAFLKFDALKLQVVGIETGTRLEAGLVSAFNNSLGTVRVGAATSGSAPTGDFVLAVVKFVPRDTTRLEQDLRVDFDEAVGGETVATFEGVSVLRNLATVKFTLLKPTVDLLLTTDFTRTGQIPVIIKVRPNGQSVSTVDAFLDFDPQTLRVRLVGGIESGDWGRCSQVTSITLLGP